MRIITHGDLQELGQVYCSKCHCLFGYNKNDIQYKHNFPDAEPGLSVELIIPYVVCPECGQVIAVEGIRE